MQHPKIEIHKVKAELCKRSLFYFVKEFWNVANTNDYVHNWHIEYICDEVQLIIDKWVFGIDTEIPLHKWYEGFGTDVKKNNVINVPPGSTKSTIVTRMACAWVWGKSAKKTIITNTIDGKNATDFATATIDIIQSEKFQLYFPDVKIRHDASAKTFYVSTDGGKRYSLTTRGSKTGKHADLIIDDDPMDYESANSPQAALQCIEGFKALQTRKKDKERVPYILVMQRLSTKDTSAHALKTLDDVKHICLPAEDLYDNISPSELRKHYVNGLLDAKRLSKEILDSQRKGLSDDSKPISDIAYNIQFNQISQTVEGLLYPAINLVPALPENRSDIIRLSFTDVADTGADYFATWFVEINGGRIYIFDAIYTQEGSGTTSESLKTRISQHSTVINQMETNNQGSVYITWLQSQGVNISGYRSSSNKEQRIAAYAQFMPYIYFVDPSNHPNQEYKQAVKHIQAYPKQGKSEDGHDDAEDALTEIFRYIWDVAKWRHLLGETY
jgi:predicted phage terminase large subunit-like protein